MEWLDILYGAAAVTTVVAAVMVAVNISAGITASGFIVFIVASIAWIVIGWQEDSAAIMIQNAILLLVNIAGVYRWLPRAAGASAPAAGLTVTASPLSVPAGPSTEAAG